MIKRLLVLSLILVLVTSLGFSQAKNGGIARMIALGGGNPSPEFVVNPFVYDDPTWTLLNPAYLGMYKDYAWMNVAGGRVTGAVPDAGLGQQFTGVNFSLGKTLTLGAILSYDPSSFSTLRPALNGFIAQVGKRAANPTGLAQPGPLETFEVLGAFDMGGMDLGVGVMYGWTNSDYKNSDTTAGAVSEASLPGHLFGIRAGIFFDLGGGSSVNGSATFRTLSASDKVTVLGSTNGTGESNYSAGATEFGVNASARLKVSSKFSFIPYGAFGTVSITPKEDNVVKGDSTTKRANDISTTAFAVGVGGEYRTPSFLLAGGVSLATSSATTTPKDAAGKELTKTTNSLFAFPVFNLGMEWWFTDWLAGRAGYFRSFSSTGTKTEPPAGSGWTQERNVFAGTSFLGGPTAFPWTISSYSSDGLVTLGIGLKFKGFALDGTVSEEALRRGLGLIGAADNINTFGYVTISYCFE